MKYLFFFLFIPIHLALNLCSYACHLLWHFKAPPGQFWNDELMWLYDSWIKL